MGALFSTSIKDANNAATKPSILQSLEVKQQAFKPIPGTLYGFSTYKWRPLRLFPLTTRTAAAQDGNNAQTLTTLHVITWNVDFMAPETHARMRSALDYLITLADTVPRTAGLVIMLQEMLKGDIALIMSTPWVRDRFHITDVDSAGWRGSHYGTTTLVDRRLAVAGVSRLPFVSQFMRDALLVDVVLGRNSDTVHVQPAARETLDSGPSSLPDAASNGRQLIRICNVHLDSLAGEPPLRPIQHRAVARALKEARAGIAAGDMNAIRPYDAPLPAENGLSDAYLALGGIENADEGHTWGYHTLLQSFPPNRLDKILFCGGVEAQPVRTDGTYANGGKQADGWEGNGESLRKVGVGVKVSDEEALKRLEESNYGGWITDHYGLWAQFKFTDGMGMVASEPAVQSSSLLSS